MKGVAQAASPNRCVGITDADRNQALLLAVHTSYGSEIAKLKMQLVKYRQALLDNGIEPPDAESKDLLEMWEVCRRVIGAAHECIANLGTSKELLFPMKKR